MRFFFAFGTSVSLGGDPIRWAAIHRHHHGFSDTPNDIHSPVHGFHYAQGFRAHKINQETLREMLPLAADVRHYWFQRWLFDPICYMLPHLAVAVALGAIWGWPGVLWCLYVPLVTLTHVTHAVNSFGHMPAFGYRRFDTRDTSTNVPWLALLTLGDSWHNNHHAAPRRPRPRLVRGRSQQVRHRDLGTPRVGPQRGMVKLARSLAGPESPDSQ